MESSVLTKDEFFRHLIRPQATKPKTFKLQTARTHKPQVITSHEPKFYLDIMNNVHTKIENPQALIPIEWPEERIVGSPSASELSQMPSLAFKCLSWNKIIKRNNNQLIYKDLEEVLGKSRLVGNFFWNPATKKLKEIESSSLTQFASKLKKQEFDNLIVALKSCIAYSSKKLTSEVNQLRDDFTLKRKKWNRKPRPRSCSETSRTSVCKTTTGTSFLFCKPERCPN